MTKRFFCFLLAFMLFAFGCKTTPTRTTTPQNRLNEPPLALHEAVQAGDLECVKELLADGADVNAKDDLGMTALHQAVKALIDPGNQILIRPMSARQTSLVLLALYNFLHLVLTFRLSKTKHSCLNI